MARCDKINSNKFIHRIEIQEPQSVADGAGGFNETYVKRHDAYAAVEPYRGQERYDQLQARAIITHKITMRYQAGVNIKDQILFNSRTFGIIEVINVEERNEYLELLAVENTR